MRMRNLGADFVPSTRIRINTKIHNMYFFDYQKNKTIYFVFKKPNLPSLSRVLGTMTVGLGVEIRTFHFKYLIIKIIRITNFSVDAYARFRDKLGEFVQQPVPACHSSGIFSGLDG